MVAQEQAPTPRSLPLTSNGVVQGRPRLQSSLPSGTQIEASSTKAEYVRVDSANLQTEENTKKRGQTGQDEDETNNIHITSLFAALPTYGPPTAANKLQYLLLRVSSSILSVLFLLTIVIASMITSVPDLLNKAFYTCTFRNYDKRRIFYDEEQRRAEARQAKERSWKRRMSCGDGPIDQEGLAQRYQPTEGGRDPITNDIAYYARRVGLDVEKIKVKTEDGFLIDLWHVYDPSEYAERQGTSRPQPPCVPGIQNAAQGPRCEAQSAGAVAPRSAAELGRLLLRRRRVHGLLALQGRVRCVAG